MRYTHGHHESVLRSHRWRTAENSCAYLLPHLHPEVSLLDVGCGPATITADLAGRVASIVGIDPSASVIEAAGTEHPGLDLRVDDLFAHEGRYDVVHAHQVVQHLDDPVGALHRMGELGTLVAVRDSDYTAFQWEPAVPALDDWRQLYLAVCRRNGAFPDAGRHLLQWSHEAGLTDVRYSTSTWTFSSPEDVTWWSGLWADRATKSDFATQAVEYGLASVDDLERIAEGWRTWGTSPLAHITLLHGELLASADFWVH
jgi:SAM-dependent methyltransferase